MIRPQEDRIGIELIRRRLGDATTRRREKVIKAENRGADLEALRMIEKLAKELR